MTPENQVQCPDCSQFRTIKTWKKGLLSRCGPCLAKFRSGETSPTWKGGHRHWSQGRFGKDKNGLSWKTQRKLAWERDSYICQHCRTKKNRNPDVHHIVPFRLSQNHSLDNLVSLCQSCHLRLEAATQEVWGGQLVERISKAAKPKKFKKELAAFRSRYVLDHYLDMSQAQLAAALGMSQQAVSYLFQKLGISVDRHERRRKFIS